MEENLIGEGFKILKRSDINLMIIKGSPGTGKSFQIDKLIENDPNCIVFSGYTSEPRFYEFLHENSDKTIVFRDCSFLLKKPVFLDFLKLASELKPERKISRLVKRKEDDNTPDSIVFTGSIICELNSIPKRHKEDLDAVINRSIFIDFVYSKQEMVKLMRKIAEKLSEAPESKKIDPVSITNHLIKKSHILGRNFNLRTQKICFEIGDIDKIDLFLKQQYNPIQKLLYQLNGFDPMGRQKFVRHLMKEFDWSKRTCERRINESIELGEIKDNGAKRNSLVSLVSEK